MSSTDEPTGSIPASEARANSPALCSHRTPKGVVRQLAADNETFDESRPSRSWPFNVASGHAVLFQESIQTAAIDTQGPRGAGLVSTFSLQHLDHVDALDLLEFVYRPVD